MGLSGRGLLDRDASHLGLADDEAQRRVRYQAYVRQGASDQEIALLRSAWSRNQLTGKQRFVDGIERWSWQAEINLMGR